MDIEIITADPPKSCHTNRRGKFSGPIHALEVGQAAIFPCGDEKVEKVQARLSVIGREIAKRHGKKFVTRSIIHNGEKCIGVYRVE